MNTHKNARTNWHSRLLLVQRVREQGWSVADAASAAGVSNRTAFKWLARFKAGGQAALVDARPPRQQLPAVQAALQPRRPEHGAQAPLPPLRPLRLLALLRAPHAHPQVRLDAGGARLPPLRARARECQCRAAAVGVGASAQPGASTLKSWSVDMPGRLRGVRAGCLLSAVWSDVTRA